LPCHFGRGALCCDVFIPMPIGTAIRDDEGKKRSESVKVRLVNVHLDSLAINNSLRSRQVEIVAGYLRAAGRGVVAGDFNPVKLEDVDLTAKNGLVDCWMELRPGAEGFTWGFLNEA
jgi:tyrosyl-DNA phosphodiesterase 2